MARRLSGKVVVVTGASSGIGRAAALRFAKQGAAVALAARSKEALEEVRAAIAQAGGKAIAVECDVADEDAVERLASEAERMLGPIDVWVNDAAIYAMGRFEDTPPEVFRRVIETKLRELHRRAGEGHAARLLPRARGAHHRLARAAAAP